MISEPTTIVSKGVCSRPSTYEVLQHKYMGGGHPGCGGWIELIEIKNPPDDRCPFIIYEYWSHKNSHESFFWEWRTLGEAMAAYEFAGWHNQREKFRKAPGFLRFVICQNHTPWFYAQEIIPWDYVPPEGWLF